MSTYFFCILASFVCLSKAVVATNAVVTNFVYQCLVVPDSTDNYYTYNAQYSIQGVTIEDGQYYAQVSYSVPSATYDQQLASIEETVPDDVVYYCSDLPHCTETVLNIPFDYILQPDGQRCTPDITIQANYRPYAGQSTTIILAAGCSNDQAMAAPICWNADDEIAVSATITSSTTAEVSSTTAGTTSAETTATVTGSTSAAAAAAAATTTTSGPEKTVLQTYPQCTIVPDMDDSPDVSLSVNSVYIENGQYYAEIAYFFPTVNEGQSLQQIDIEEPVSDSLYNTNSGLYVFPFTPVQGETAPSPSLESSVPLKRAVNGQLCLPDIQFVGVYPDTILNGIASCSSNDAIAAGTCFYPPDDTTTSTSIIVSSSGAAATTATGESSSVSVTATTATTATNSETSTVAFSTDTTAITNTVTAAGTDATTVSGSTTATLSGTATTETFTSNSSTAALTGTLSSTGTDATTTAVSSAATVSASSTDAITTSGSITGTLSGIVTDTTTSTGSVTSALSGSTTDASTTASLSSAATETSTLAGSVTSGLSVTATGVSTSPGSETAAALSTSATEALSISTGSATAVSFSSVTTGTSVATDLNTATISSGASTIPGADGATTALFSNTTNSAGAVSGSATLTAIASASGSAVTSSVGRSSSVTDNTRLTSASTDRGLLTTRTVTLTEGTKVITTITVCPLTESGTSSSMQLTTKVITVTQGTRVYTTTTVCPLTEVYSRTNGGDTGVGVAGGSPSGVADVTSRGKVVTVITQGSNAYSTTVAQARSIETSLPANPPASSRNSVATLNSYSQPWSSSFGVSAASLDSGSAPNVPVQSPPPAGQEPSSSQYHPAGASQSSSAAGVAAEVSQSSQTPLQGSAVSLACSVFGSVLSVAFAYFLF